MNDHSQTVTYNREYEQRTNKIYVSSLWDLEILGRPNWESTQLTSIGKGQLNGPYKVWLMLWLQCKKSFAVKVTFKSRIHMHLLTVGFF